MRKISNENHVAQIVKAIYAAAQELDWEHLTHAQHTDWYGRWLADKAIGGLLTTWMSPEAARVWLKDGPMKEYSRALAGEGTFAKYLDEHPRAPDRVVRYALGPKWSVVKDSVTVKPLQCRAACGQESINLFWGPVRDFKHLLWAALMADSEQARIVVWDTVANPLSDAEQDWLLKVGRRCSVEVKFIRL